MQLQDIGEFGLIQLLARELGVAYPPVRGAAPPPGLQVGLGDDAVVTQRRDGALVWTTDTMVAGEHFLPGRSDWAGVGWKSLASNVSDVAAMGATPHLALVTLALPPDFAVGDALDLYRGLKQCAEAYGVTLGGGDIVRSPVFAITVALSGWAFIPRLGSPGVLRRDTARPGDLVAVSGSLGDSAAGVRLLLSHSRFETEAEQVLRRAHERPQPRVALGRRAVQAGLRCGIDVSDGLLQDLGHIATASGVSVRVEAERLPISPALREVFPEQALELALGGGEDYELVLIGPAGLVRACAGDAELTVIGEVIAAEAPGVQVVDASGREIELKRRGWDHFSQ